MTLPCRITTLGLIALLFQGIPATARVLKTKIERVPVKIQRLYKASASTVKVSVKDERAPDPLLASGNFGFGSRVGFYTEDPAAVQKAIETAALDALPVLGLKQGEGVTLEIALKELRVDSFVKLGPLPHGIAYLRASVSVRSGDGKVQSEHAQQLAVHARGPLNILFARLGWALAATALPEALALEPDAVPVADLARALGESSEEAFLEQATIWAGIAGAQNPSMAGRLLALFRTAEKWNVSENALLSLATMKSPLAMQEIQGILTGTNKVKNWDTKDAARSWHLIRALSILGEKSLTARIPKVSVFPEILTDLVSFLDTGRIPPFDPKTTAEISKLRDEARKTLGN